MSQATLDALRAREAARRPVEKPKRGKAKEEPAPEPVDETQEEDEAE